MHYNYQKICRSKGWKLGEKNHPDSHAPQEPMTHRMSECNQDNWNWYKSFRLFSTTHILLFSSYSAWIRIRFGDYPPKTTQSFNPISHAISPYFDWGSLVAASYSLSGILTKKCIVRLSGPSGHLEILAPAERSYASLERMFALLTSSSTLIWSSPSG